MDNILSSIKLIYIYSIYIFIILMEEIEKELTALPLNAEYDRIEAIFLKDFGSKHACISAIYKVCDFSAGFEACAAEIAAKRGKAPERIYAYHGTRSSSAIKICKSGFDPSYSTIAVYGKGSYASPCPRTALRYCKDVKDGEAFSMVFLCKFLKGTFRQYSSGAVIDTTIADYSGNGSNIIVTPYRFGMIPEYLICYYAST